MGKGSSMAVLWSERVRTYSPSFDDPLGARAFLGGMQSNPLFETLREGWIDSVTCPYQRFV